MMKVNYRRGSQVVRHGSAKAVFVGSIPTLASNFFKKTEKPAHPAAKNPVLSPDESVFAMVGGYLFRRGSRFKIMT